MLCSLVVQSLTTTFQPHKYRWQEPEVAVHLGYTGPTPWGIVCRDLSHVAGESGP